jgi:phosphate-selective porin OprO/OprP
MTVHLELQLQFLENKKHPEINLPGFSLTCKKYSWSSIKMLAFILCLLPCVLYAQKDTKLPDGTDGMVFTPRAADTVFVDKKSDLEANEFEGKYATFRVGMGFIGDFTGYSQNAVFKQQMDSAGLDLKPNYQTRDARILGSGRILTSKRYLAYKFSYMYDGDKKVWMMRETGVTIGVPELKGNFFVGRTKEGFSMIKVMNGHSGVTNERQMALDPIPILADGVKYMGYYPKSKTFLNLGYFNDVLSKGQSFSTFSSQWVVRAGWLPIYNKDNNTLLHIAGEFQYGKPLNGEMTLKSRPESNPTPQLINTGVFATNKSFHYGGEIYYRTNRFMIGSEIVSHNFYSNATTSHQFNGGDAMVSYFFTKTARPYNTVGNIFGFVPVKKSVFEGGLGEIEGVLHFSTFNLNDKDIKGGQMTRITPMINWYLSKWLRWELVYGYGILNRYGLKGNVQFFETRIQVTLM